MSKEYLSVYINYQLGRETLTQLRDNFYLGTLKGSGIARQEVNNDPRGVAAALKSLLDKLGIDEPILLFDYPYWSPILLFFDAYKVLYNCMDDYTEFNDLALFKERIDAQEQFLFEKADLVYCTAHGLLKKAKEKSDNALLIPNACEFNHFSEVYTERPKQMPSSPVVGFVGAIAEWFNQAALAHVSDTLNYWNFVLIGNSHLNISTLKNRKNVHLWGEQKYNLIPGYLKYFDVAIIPFDHTRSIMKNCDPVKMYEYLAAGKPIVSSPLPEVIKAKKDIHIAKTIEDWPDLIKAAYEQSKKLGFAEHQKESVKEDTWENRVDQLLKEMKKIGC